MDLSGRVTEAVHLWRRNRPQEALDEFQRLASLAPHDYGIRYHAGLALKDLGRVAEARLAFLAAARLNPMRPEPSIALANLEREDGRIEAAMLGYRRALALDPHSLQALQNLALILHYDARADGAAIKGAAVAWAREVEGAEPSASTRPVDGDPDRRLRVGFLSPDLRRHSCAFFAEPLIRHLPPDRVERFIYADVWSPDDVTARFEGLSDHFANVSTDSDADLVARLRRDGLDILVDLAGHTGNNRLALFAWRLAPVQITWLGCPGTTGLQSMDARITDAWADPPGDSDHQHTESLLRLDPVFLCFQPSRDAPEVAPVPSLAQEPFTFGSFNTFSQSTPGTVALWSRILTTLPGSRLFLKDRAMHDPAHQAEIRNRFKSEGILPERILCAGWQPTDRQHYAAYSHVDLALDPFPYNGTTTTCEALWMGVPVVTLAGSRHAGRVGMSLCQAVGLPELVAQDADDYVRIAT